jgi:hypothetical protein
MPLIQNFALLLAASLFAAGIGACSSESRQSTTSDAIVGEEATGVATSRAQPQLATPVPTPPSTGEYKELPLADLAPEAVEYLDARAGSAGMAVVVPSRGAIYTWNGHEKFHMASVAKVSIMLTLMSQALEAGRGLTDEEMSNLRPMITVSDNTRASVLWARIGGGDAVERYLREIGLLEIDPNKDDCWGASYASAHDTALLFAKLALGEILDDGMRSVAIDLLQQVDPSQTWGVIAAAPDDRPEGTIVGVKDGWYPADCGWWVNSAGMLVPGNDKPAYTIAVLTDEQATLQYGIETIEAVGEMIHARLHAE